MTKGLSPHFEQVTSAGEAVLVRRSPFWGLPGFVIRPGQTTGLNQLIGRAIRNHEGPLLAMHVAQKEAVVEAALARYQLARLAAQCAVIVSSFDHGHLRLCPVERAQ